MLPAFKKSIVAAAALAVLAGLFISGCGGDGPSDAVENFIYAAADQDCPAMIDLLSGASRSSLGSTREEAIDNCQQQLLQTTSGVVKTEVTRFEVTGVETEGDEATVYFSMAVKVVGGNEEVPRADFLKAVKEDGGWKIVTD